ncbi:HET-domain-containing protein [Karstenula rhodostoma CBS 690.94]|uniref:HET-domain-containing protein n=1 Tax=Karstenula rhodostoma CBS 690.94 TaxID=1392251 RepID=A0A9P4PD40_9PLEO|nr:HET-domain-containing protein [Karstenula rhodostoma CBS 690.94]
MWLLDTKTITLSQQSDDNVRYAILSHRWGNDNDEVSFTDIQHPRSMPRKKGYDKIEKCCKQALRDGYKYAWVDTCCIDKRSSAELQEAINSMFRWYERAGVCYAYLEDVPLRRMEESEWFTRGWTLQELLAPRVVQFFDNAWKFLGDHKTLLIEIHEATKIEPGVLQKTMSLHNCSIAERMSWAAGRRTKRIEDRAYSLFGIFQVHLPMLYGEREAAFQRLQQAILRTSEDDTLFAWTGVTETHAGLLAPNLEAFRDGALLQTDASGPLLRLSGSDATERSIGITAKLIPWHMETYLVFLGCIRHEDGRKEGVGIYLRMLDEDNSFARIEFSGVDLAFLPIPNRDSLLFLGMIELLTPCKRESWRTWAVSRSISVRQLPLLENHKECLKEKIYGFQVSTPADRILAYPAKLPGFVELLRPSGSSQASAGVSISDVSKRENLIWAVDGTFLDRGIVGALHSQAHPIRDIHFGFDHLFNPILYIRKATIIQRTVTIDSFLKWANSPKSLIASLSSLFISILPPYAEQNDTPIQEAYFWNERKSYRVFDHGDRDFWAIRVDRKKVVELCFFPEVPLWLKLKRVPTQYGMVWDITLEAEKTITQILEDVLPGLKVYE